MMNIPNANNSQRNSIEQNIIDAVEISKESRIPVLFMSNPGLGKTTILTRYADHLVQPNPVEFRPGPREFFYTSFCN